MSECDNCKNKKDWPCPNTCGYMGTCDGWEPKPTTNGDKLRAMSDEELAEWIETMADCRMCQIAEEHCSGGETNSRASCMIHWLDWLKQEAE